MLFPGWIYIARGLWHLSDFCNIVQRNTNKDRKNFTIWVRGYGTVPYGKYGAGYCITLIKSLDEGLR